MPSFQTILGEIYVDDHGAAGEPVAVLWPSLFCDHRMWGAQVPVLRELGYRTLALDPPGHGRSPGPGRRFTMDECARAVLEILDAAAIDTPIVFFGTSWGGFVAPRVALRAPERVRGFVVFNTSADRATLAQRLNAMLLTKLFTIGALRAKMAKTVAGSMLAPATEAEQPELATRIATDLASWDPHGVVLAIRSVLVDRVSVYDELASIAAPALVVAGGSDPIFPPLAGERLAAKLRDARRVAVAGAGHLVPLEKPQAANELVVDFLRALPPI